MKRKIGCFLFVVICMIVSGMTNAWAAPVPVPEIPSSFMPYLLMGIIGLTLVTRKLFKK